MIPWPVSIEDRGREMAPQMSSWIPVSRRKRTSLEGCPPSMVSSLRSVTTQAWISQTRKRLAESITGEMRFCQMGIPSFMASSFVFIGLHLTCQVLHGFRDLLQLYENMGV